MTIPALNLVLSPSAITWFVMAAVCAAIAIWWIVLVRRRKMWFPLLRRLAIPPRVKPRIRLEPPPLVPFLCFVAAAIAALLLSGRPGRLEPVAREQPSIRSHLLVDLSPSVSRVPLQDLAARAGEIWEFLAKAGKVTVGTSSSFAVATPSSREQLERLVIDAGYARAGVRLGNVLQKQIEGVGAADDSGTVERVVVLSDEDRHSWAGLNLAWFSGGTRLFRATLQKVGLSPENIFIESATRLSADDPGAVRGGAHGGLAATEVWEVELLRRPAQDSQVSAAVSGTLEVLEGEQVVGRTSWTFPASNVRLVLSVEVKAGGDRLLFRIDPATSDLIKGDNEFRSWRDAGAGKIHLVSEPVGEGLMQESSWQLTTVLSLLGFEVVRHDSSDSAIRRIGREGASLPEAGVLTAERGTRWILLAGVEGHAEEICSPQMVKQLKANDSVWLAPRNIASSWRDLCVCYVRLAGVEPRRDFCAEVNGRVAWTGLLPSLGARQVGGKLGDDKESFAWRGVLRGGDADDESDGRGGDLLAFTLPLMPSVTNGINHARFPLIVRELIRFQAPGSGMKVGSWPRIADSAAADASKSDDVTLSNIPAAESLLQEVPPAELPELLRFGSMETNPDSLQSATLSEQRQNPWPWVRGLAAVAGGAIAVELAWMAMKRWMAAGSAMFLCGVFWAAWIGNPQRAHAAVVEIVIAGESGSATFTRLSREVASRTSITLAKRARGFSGTSAIPDVPWIWVDGVGALTGPGGQLKSQFGNWLRRGGFLVIEGVTGKEKLDAMFSREFPSDAGWQPVPTDHELMRSFYLLDSLPSCGNAIWHQFSFDGRVAAVAIPGRLTRSLQDSGGSLCPGDRGPGNPPRQEGNSAIVQQIEIQHRAFVNLLMVALTTDYKKDQVHLPEILKRLR